MTTDDLHKAMTPEEIYEINQRIINATALMIERYRQEYELEKSNHPVIRAIKDANNGKRGHLRRVK